MLRFMHKKCSTSAKNRRGGSANSALPIFKLFFLYGFPNRHNYYLLNQTSQDTQPNSELLLGKKTFLCPSGNANYRIIYNKGLLYICLDRLISVFESMCQFKSVCECLCVNVIMQPEAYNLQDHIVLCKSIVLVNSCNQPPVQATPYVLLELLVNIYLFKKSHKPL